MARKGLKGKVVVVTGASSGNGRAIALHCADRGAKLVLAARTLEPLLQVQEEVEALGGEAFCAPTDVTERAEVQELVMAAVQRYGRIDAWVNNAGGAFFGSLEASTPALMDWLLRLNVYSVIHGTQSVLPQFRLQGHGHLVNIGSVAGRVAFPYMGFYSATKAFVGAYTQALREEMLAEGLDVKVSLVMPTAVRTPFFDKAPNLSEKRLGAYLAGPVLEATQVGRAVADCLERYRPVVLPYRPAKGLLVLQSLFPALMDRLMPEFRSDRPEGMGTRKAPGSDADERPIPPFVVRGRLTDRAPRRPWLARRRQ